MHRLAQRLFLSLAASVVVFGFTGCACVFTGTSQKVVFTSPQPNSSVTVENQKYALPVTTRISKKTKTATFTNPSYAAKQLEWKRSFMWGFLIMDILFTPGYGLSGMIVDGSTSAWFSHPGIIDYDFATGVTSVKEAKSERKNTTPRARNPRM